MKFFISFISGVFLASFVLKPLLGKQSEKPEIFVQMGHSNDVRSVAYSPDGKNIASGGWDNTIKLWEVATGREIRTLSGHSSSVHSVAYSPDGKYIASGSGDETVKLWEVTTGREIRTLSGHSLYVKSISYSPDGKHIASGSYKEIKLWEVATGREIRTLSGHSAGVNSVAYSPDGKYIASGSDDNTIKLWEVATGREIKALSGHSDDVNSVAYLPDGKYIASGSWDKTVKLWEVTTGREVRTLSGHSSLVNSVAYSPDGKYIASGSDDNTIKLWEVATGREIRTLSGHRSFVNSVAYSPDGKYIASESFDNTIKLWEVATGKEIRILSGHSGNVLSAAYSPDGKYIASGSRDCTTRLWNAQTGKEIAMFVSFNDGEWVVMTPDGYFNCSLNGAKNINVRIGMNVYSIDNFFETYYRPDIVKARLAGISTTDIAKADITKSFKLPPQINLQALKNNQSFSAFTTSDSKDLHIAEGTIKVKVIATDAGGGIQGVRLFNNNKSVGENIRGFKKVQSENTFEQEFTVTLTEGENTLKAVGFSDDMTESNPVTAIVTYSAPKQAKPDMYILAIGINEYRNGKYNLNYCVADMTGFVGAITPIAKKIFGNVNTNMITNRDANRVNVLKAMDEIKTKAKPEDVFIVFYAGHGIALDVQDGEKTKSEFFYVLSDVTQMTDPQKCSQEGLSGTEMRKLLSEIKAGKQVMFVDACNSGAFAAQFAVRGAAEENALAKLSRATGSVIYASTTKEQFATEFTELKHGAFTYVLIDALGGKASLANGQITVSSIKAFVDDQIPAITKKYKGEEQFPTTFIWGQDFPIGVK